MKTLKVVLEISCRVSVPDRATNPEKVLKALEEELIKEIRYQTIYKWIDNKKLAQAKVTKVSKKKG